MGEIAEMMLDGTLCATCGVALVDEDDMEPQGFPGYCSQQCARDAGVFECEAAKRPSFHARRAAKQNRERQAAAGKTHACPECWKMFRGAFAVEQHVRDKHTPKAGECL